MALIDKLVAIEREHYTRLQQLQDEQERAIVRQALQAERRIIEKLRAFLPQFETQRVAREFRILNTEANRMVVTAIVNALGEELKDFEDWGTEWMAEALRQGYEAGSEKSAAVGSVGYGRDLEVAFTANDAAVLETALTKGYGKELRGLGKIKGITQETSDLIRDTLVRGLHERLTLPELEQRLYDAETGLTSLETIDSRGVRRVLSLRARCRLIAQNEVAEIYQIAAVEKSRDIFGDDPLWRYGSVPEWTRMTEWCKRRYGRVAKVSQWHDEVWVREQFGDSRTGTGHIHVNCRQSGFPVDPTWDLDRR